MKKYIGITAFALFVSSAVVHAVPNDKMTEHLSSTIETASRAFSLAYLAQGKTSTEQDEWEFKDFFLTIAPKVTFGIRDVVDIEISPSITLIWEKSKFE